MSTSSKFGLRAAGMSAMNRQAQHSAPPQPGANMMQDFSHVMQAGQFGSY